MAVRIWQGRAKLMQLTKKNPEAAKRRKELFKRMNTDHDNNVSLEEAKAAIKKMWPEFDSASCPLAQKTNTVLWCLPGLHRCIMRTVLALPWAHV